MISRTRHLAAQVVKVHRNPFRHMRNIEFLPERQVEGIQNQTRSERIHKERRGAGQAGDDKLANLRRGPGFGVDESPSLLQQSCGGDDAKQDHTQRPRAVRINPETKQRRNQK